MKHITSSSNERSGLTLHGIRMPVAVSESKFLSNRNGVFISGTSSAVKFHTCEMSKQKENGILASNSDGWISVTNTSLSNNLYHGFSYNKLHVCHKKAAHDRFAIHFYVNSSTYAGNKASGIHINSNCRVNISVETSNFTNNKLGNNITHNSHIESNAVHLIVIQNNEYTNNTRGISIDGVSSLEMQIKQNKFVGHSGHALNITTGSKHRYARRSIYSITKNSFVNNNAMFDSLVTIIVQSNSEYSNIRDFNFVENYMKGNFYVKPQRHFVYNRRSKQAIIHVQTGTNMDLHHNILDNPDAEIQLYAADENPKLIQKAHHCYWGATNIDDIADLVIGYHSAVGHSQVQILPFLRSNDSNDFDPNFWQEQTTFMRKNTIGGHVKGHMSLSNKAKPYIVVNDIIITKNNSLSVSPGVTLLFAEGKSIYVEGKLKIEGTVSDIVTLGLFRDSKKYMVRLDYPHEDLEGIVQMNVNGKWHNVCNSNYKNRTSITTADFLCQALGYEKAVKNDFVIGQTKLPSVSIQCPQNAMHLEACELTNISYCSGLVSRIKCLPSHWSGIHFSYQAEVSTLKYVHIDQVGYPNGLLGHIAIQSDIHRHQFEHITLTNLRNDSSTVGMKIIKIDLASNQLIRNISMQDFDHKGTGIVSHDSRILLSNIVLKNSFRFKGHGIYIKPSFVQLPSLLHNHVRSVCFSSVHHVSGVPLFVRVWNSEIKKESKCELLITADPGMKVSVQVITGKIEKCGIKDLLFYDGHMNDSAPNSLQINSDGYTWTSTGNMSHIIMHNLDYWECIDVIIQISSVQG